MKKVKKLGSAAPKKSASKRVAKSTKEVILLEVNGLNLSGQGETVIEALNDVFDKTVDIPFFASFGSFQWRGETRANLKPIELLRFRGNRELVPILAERFVA